MENIPKAVITINGHSYDADLLVFDKDGLMFESEQFWIELANARIRQIRKHCSEADTRKWAKLMSVGTTEENGQITAVKVDPMGILAVAAPTEEITILAGFLTAAAGLMWHDARQLARDIFALSDEDIDLKRGLKPQPGFLSLMRRLADSGIPYGVATSDTYERTRDSMALFDCWEAVRFVVTPLDVAHGKPEPDMLEYIAEKQNVPLHRIVMIGDSYVDVKMAHAAGAVGIGVTADPEMRGKMLPFAAEIIPSLEMLEVRSQQI